VVTGHIVPLDPVGVEVVEDGEAGLGAGGLLPGRPVVGLGQASASGVGPVLTVRESDCPRVGVGPSHQLVSVVNNTSGPEEPLGVLGNKPVELVLLVRGVEGDRLHAHGLAILPSLVLLKVTAAKLPGHHEALALPEVVGSLGGALGGASRDGVGGSRGEARLGRLPHWLGRGLGPEGWSLLEASLRGGTRLELLMLRLWLELLLLGLELLLLRLEELLLLLRLELLLLLLLLKLGPWPLWLGSII